MSEPYNPRLQKLVFEIIDNQLPDKQIHKKIGGVFVEHLYYVMKDNVPMDTEQYVKDLRALK